MIMTFIKNILWYVNRLQLHCCGNRGYADWFNMYPPKDIPLSCCKVSEDKCDSSDTSQIYIEVRVISNFVTLLISSMLDGKFSKVGR